MINLQKLFRSIRLNPCDEFQAKQIKGMLAQLEVENPTDAAIIATAYEERKKMLCPVVDVETNETGDEAVIEAGDVETNETPTKKRKNKKDDNETPLA